MDTLRLAITGATGFVGGRLLAATAARGLPVRALTRRPRPATAGVEWIAGDLDDARALAALCDGAGAVIHLAAVVNPLRRADFERVNVSGTGAVLTAAARVPRFVQVSSLTAREPGLSRYGASKAVADTLVMAARPDAAIVRPGGVYGPGDRDMLPLFVAARRGLVPVPPAGRASLIHADDLVEALLTLAADAAAGVFEAGDGTRGGVTHRELARAISVAVGSRPRMVEMPVWALKVAGAAGDMLGRLTGRAPRLSIDRARYLAHPDWVADNASLTAATGWTPRIALADGLADTVAWYRDHGWL